MDRVVKPNMREEVMRTSGKAESPHTPETASEVKDLNDDLFEDTAVS